jgi:hypothetical protein
MDEERIPESEPSGALVPPPVHPPTALAAAVPLPPRRWEDDVDEARGVLERAVERALDALDSAGDRIAEAVGLR